jgi:hypothetical protein
MSSDLKLDVALKLLKVAGHQIGDAHIAPPPRGEGMRIWIDGVPCSFVDVFKMAEEELKESQQPG